VTALAVAALAVAALAVVALSKVHDVALSKVHDVAEPLAVTIDDLCYSLYYRCLFWLILSS
jgi:hypothetical protein